MAKASHTIAGQVLQDLAAFGHTLIQIPCRPRHLPITIWLMTGNEQLLVRSSRDRFP